MDELYTKKLEDDNSALRFVLHHILESLPVKRDWLDPGIERLAREVVKENN